MAAKRIVCRARGPYEKGTEMNQDTQPLQCRMSPRARPL